MGIFTSRAMRERGQYQLQLMKTRSSSGVGQKIELQFNVETLRITDDGGGEDESSYRPQTAPTPSPLEIITGVKPEPFTDVSQLAEIEPWNKHVVSDVQGSKLKSLLNSLKR